MVQESPFQDKIAAELSKSVVVLASVQEFPKIQILNKQILFKADTKSTRNIFNITTSMFDYFEQRLALVEERIFSHVEEFDRPKLSGQTDSNMTTVYSLHSIVGKSRQLWVFGILTQKEDTHYYLEDSTSTVKVVFTDLEYADPDAFFTENCVLLS